MSDKVTEMAAAGGATIGPIRPLGSEEELPEHTERALRLLVRSKLHEIVKKKDGRYFVYPPKKKGEKKKKPIGRSFETKHAAKKAELSRFPPKDKATAERKKKQLAKAEKEPDTKKKNESALADMERIVAEAGKQLLETRIVVRLVKEAFRKRLTEGLFQRESPGSKWDDYITKLSDRALANDPGYQRIQKAVTKAQDMMLVGAARHLKRAVGKGGRVKAYEVVHEGAVPYMPVGIETEQVSLYPIYLYVENGHVKYELSDSAKAELTKLPPQVLKFVKTELTMVQELNSAPLQTIMAKRDRYLDRLEGRVDEMLSSMSPLEISILKNLLVKKYRKLG